MWFAITYLYETTNHTDSYFQVESHKISSIIFFNKPPYDAMISIVFDKFISALCDYEDSRRMREALDEHMCITLLNSMINPVIYLRRYIKICERADNKGVGFTSQQVMYYVLEYAKIPVTFQSYAKDQSYAKTTGNIQNQKTPGVISAMLLCWILSHLPQRSYFN